MRVKCVRDEHDGVRHALTIGAEYAVIGIEAGDYRVIDDCGGAFLFPPDLFTVVDGRRPDDWVSEMADGVEYAYPPELNEVGFFEDLHERVPEAVRAFSLYLNRRLGWVA